MDVLGGSATAARLPRRLGVLVLLVIAATFAANHVAARVAFDHGTSVPSAVTIRSAFTALLLLGLLRFQRLPISMPWTVLRRALFVGLLVAVQSFCLYSAVARIPVGLALLVFNVYPMLFVLLSSAAGKETAPSPTVLIVMTIVLAGLALALDIGIADLPSRWSELWVGVGWALAAAISFVLVLYSNVHWLGAVDSRVRTFVVTAVTGCVMLTSGVATDSLALPGDETGWLALAALTSLYAVAITSLFIVLPKLGGSTGTVALNFEPIAGLALAWLLLGQALSSYQLVGVFIVVGAITYIGLRKAKPKLRTPATENA